jgi:transcriptional regulator with XRE-family HTH domain
MSKRYSSGAETRARYCAICAGVHLRSPSGSPNRRHGHRCVAFLPGVRVTLKTLKPKGFRGPLVTLGDHLKARRLALGMFQKDVAKHLGVDQWTLLNWEKNRTAPLVTAYPAIFTFLGYDPAPAPTTIADRLKARRREMGWTIDATALALNVDPTSIWGWEQGGLILHRAHRKLIADFLAIPEKEVDEAAARTWGSAHTKAARSPEGKAKSDLLPKRFRLRSGTGR